MNRILLSAMLSLLLLPATATATLYQCERDQEFWWRDGKIVPVLHSTSHEILRFNDETGQLQIVRQPNDEGKNSAGDWLNLKILQSLEKSGSQITATNGGFATVLDKQIFVGLREFHLNMDSQGNEIQFLYFSTSPYEIMSGKCHTYELHKHKHLSKIPHGPMYDQR